MQDMPPPRSGTYVVQQQSAYPARYYVGVSDDIDAHLQPWTGQNGIWKEYKLIGDGSEQDELLTRMLRHGFNQVRGGEFMCEGRYNINSSELLRAKKMIVDSGSLCLHCGDSATHVLSTSKRTCTIGDPNPKQRWLEKFEEFLEIQLRRESQERISAANAMAVATAAATRKRKIDELSTMAHEALNFRGEYEH